MLLADNALIGARGGTQTHISGLEDRGPIRLNDTGKVVLEAGFEPTTFDFGRRRAVQLRHSSRVTDRRRSR